PEGRTPIYTRAWRCAYLHHSRAPAAGGLADRRRAFRRATIERDGALRRSGPTERRAILVCARACTTPEHDSLPYGKQPGRVCPDCPAGPRHLSGAERSATGGSNAGGRVLHRPPAVASGLWLLGGYPGDTGW